MQHLFVINPKSFRSSNRLEKVFLEIENCFTVKRREMYQVYLSRKPRDAVTAVRRFILNSPENVTTRVYAIGGDGILFDCLNAINGLPNTELANVPYGNANDFIRAFGENLNDDFRNIKEQVGAGTILTDVLDTGTNLSLNSLMVGVEGFTILKMWKFYINHSILTKIGLYKNSFAVKTIVCAILALCDKETRTQHYTIEVDGEDLSGSYVTINMSNGPCYGGNMIGASEATPNDGFIDFIAIRGTSLINMILRDLPVYTTGRFRQFSNDKYVFRRAKSIHIQSDKPLKISADGEPYISKELKLTIKPNAVKFVNVKGYTYRNSDTADAAETVDVAEAIETVKPTETVETTEPTVSAEAAEVTDTVEPTETAEVTEAVESTETVETAEMAEVTESVETTEAEETAEQTETVEVPETVEASEQTETADEIEELEGVFSE